MMQDENILIRALEPEDLEYLYKWENDMDLWDVSDTLTPFSHFTLKKYIENAHVDRMTLHHGIKNSQSLPKNPQNLAGPGTISALMHPVHSSSSRSITCPKQ